MEMVFNIAVFSLNRMRPGGAILDGRRSGNLSGPAACDAPREVSVTASDGIGAAAPLTAAPWQGHT